MFDSECRQEDTSHTYSYEVKYEYLGSGKFSNVIVVNKKSIADLDCSKISVFSNSEGNKLCTRNNNIVECYNYTSYSNMKSKMIELFGESNCTNKGDSLGVESYHCMKNKDYCDLRTDENGIYCYTEYDI